MEISVKFVSNDLVKTLDQFIATLAKDVELNAKKNTPVRTGNARRNWTNETTKNNFVVKNKVPYIERLEAGASRQAPKGIIGPTLTTIKGKYK